MKDYKTSKYYLAAALSTFGIPYKDTQLIDNQMFYIYEDSDLLQKAIKAYMSDTLSLPAYSYFQKLKIFREYINGQVDSQKRKKETMDK